MTARLCACGHRIVCEAGHAQEPAPMRCHLHGVARSPDCALCALFTELEERAPGAELEALRERVDGVEVLLDAVDRMLETGRRLRPLSGPLFKALVALSNARRFVK